MPAWFRLACLAAGLAVLPVLLRAQSAPVRLLPRAMSLHDLATPDAATPVPLAVLDFTERTEDAAAPLGHFLADRVAMELANLPSFTPVARTARDAALQALQITAPLAADRARLADRLRVPYLLYGELERIRTVVGRDGRAVEVTASLLVEWSVTRLPIAGARVTARSAPRPGKTGDPSVLMQEALSIAAYQLVQRLAEIRIPVGINVTGCTMSNFTVISGGSTIGFREGMRCLAIRRGAVTGTVRLTEVHSRDSTGDILEDVRGIAAGDQIIPIDPPHR